MVESGQRVPEDRAWKAVACSAAQPLAFPGLTRDAQQIAVAARGFIRLDNVADDHRFGQLVRLLGPLTQILKLPDQIQVAQPVGSREYLVHLDPGAGEADWAAVYDGAAAAARCAGGRLYIGAGRHYVQYRDARAPRGYDVPGFQPPPDSDGLWLIDRRGSHRIAAPRLPRVDAARLCLRVPLVSDPPPQGLEKVHALAPAPLGRLLTRYLRGHGMRYRLALVQADERELVLLEVTPHSGAPSGPALPAFVLDYLSGFPRVALLCDAYEDARRRVLVQWRHRYPLVLPHVAEAFPPDQLVLLMTGEHASLAIHPAPTFFADDQMTRLHGPPRPVQAASGSITGRAPWELPVLLRPDRNPAPPIQALVLSPRELGWLRQLVYRLPRDSFRALRLFPGEPAVLLSDDGPIEGVPFGEPLRRLGDSGLFYPLRTRFVPDLPRELLLRCLGVPDDGHQEGHPDGGQDGACGPTYTFLTDRWRVEIPRAQFTALSCALVADPGRPTAVVKMQPPAELPKIRWPLPSPPDAARTGRPSAQPAATPGSRAASGKAAAPVSAAPPTGRRGVSAAADVPASDPSGPAFDAAAYFRDQAVVKQRAGDHLDAAFFHSHAGDFAAAARCYRQAVGAEQAAKE